MRLLVLSSVLPLVLLAAAGCGNDDGSADGAATDDDNGGRPGRPGTGGGNEEEEEEEDGSGDGEEADTGGGDDAGGGPTDGGGGGACSAGQTECNGLYSIRTCDASGTFTEGPCPEGSYCLDDQNACVPGLCPPFTNRCAGQREREQCAPDGSVYLPGTACAEEEYCADGACLIAGCLPSVMFAFDGSSSMTSEFDRVRASINDVTTANPDVAFGLTMFPTGLGCSIGDGRGGLFTPGVSWPDVPIAVDGAARIDQWFNDNDAAAGATPLISMLEWFSQNVDTIWEIPENGHLIVMSEGADTCTCNDSDEDRFGNIPIECFTEPLTEYTQALVARGVKVYVIGYRFTEDDRILNSIAANGGTPFAEFIFAGNEETLTTAFESVVGNAKICDQ
jgi:hypothetical protein